MTKSNDFRKNRKKEQYYKEAKKHNVRARSYFKLKQLDEKFNIIKDNIKIIDLGCSPGGWLEYIDEKIKTGKIIGIDLLEVKKQQEFSKNIEIIQDNFNNIQDYTKDKFDLILSDMAPEFTGNSTLDRGKTHKLNVETIKYAKEHLENNGILAFKSFEGEDLPWVKSHAKKVFKIVKEFKPKSSQVKSAETFIVCFNKQ